MTGYGYHAVFPTRWNDNDQYGHVNNAVYYEAMDTTINTWLIAAGLEPTGSEHIAVCASSSCEYRASVTFPDAMRVGLRAGRLGTTSVTWELAIHRAPATAPGAGRRTAGRGGAGRDDAPEETADQDDAGEDDVSRDDAGGGAGAAGEPVATGRFVHVFVDARTRRPAPIPDVLRKAIERDLVVAGA